jgi:hypothetical protein
MNNKPYDEQIDDYKDSIFAIIGFVNLFRYDDKTKKMRDDIKIFQGRRMKTSSTNRVNPDDEITPDFCVQDSENKGIVGEVKKSFPSDSDLWMDDFRQLMRYDDDLSNWLTNSGKINDHHIVLLTHSSRSRKLIRYFRDHEGKDIIFTRNFAIIEFYRNEEIQSYLFFRKEFGDLLYFQKENNRLIDGVQVPLMKLMPEYGRIKLYDSKPPLPYLIYLLWENVIMLRASDSEKFPNLRKNGKLPVTAKIDDITQELYENYSFKQLNADNSSCQPKIPLKSWIKDAIEALVTFKLAEWKDKDSEECIFHFKKFGTTLQDFINLCDKNQQETDIDQKQLDLF